MDQHPGGGHRADGWSPVRRGPLDWVLVCCVVLVGALAPRTGSESAGPDPSWVGPVLLLLALAQGVALLWRRRRPGVTAVVVIVLYAGQVAVAGAVPPLGPWVAIWAVATGAGPLRQAVRASGALTGAVVVVLVAGDLARGGAGASAFLSGVSVVVLLSAGLLRSERGRLDAVRHASAAEERMRIARDMHDALGHGLSVVAIQSSSARMALSLDDRVTADRALAAVEATSRTALRELRQLLGVLTSEHGAAAGTSATPGLASLGDLLGNLSAGGVHVTWTVDADLDTLSPLLQLGAYRIVQEAVTNAVKHRPGATISVTVREDSVVGDAAGIHARVLASGGGESAVARDDGSAVGLGLRGIEDRATSLGGWARAEPTADGWLVEAWLPVTPGEG